MGLRQHTQHSLSMVDDCTDAHFFVVHDGLYKMVIAWHVTIFITVRTFLSILHCMFDHVKFVKAVILVWFAVQVLEEVEPSCLGLASLAFCSQLPLLGSALEGPVLSDSQRG